MSAFFQESRLTGSLNAQLLDSTRLRIEQRRLFGKPRRFTVDVACLAPALTITAQEGLLGFGLAALFALALSLLSFYGLFRDELLPTAAWFGLAAGALLVTVLLSVVFRLRLFKRLVVRTRCAGLPLLTAPVLPDKRTDMEAFLAIVRIRVGEAETKRGLNPEQLRSGELKTLRRLVQEQVIESRSYEDAKSVILAR